MNPRQTSRFFLMAGWALGGCMLGCSSVELTTVPKKPLPSQPPLLTELTLELPQDEGPRRPVDATTPSMLSGSGPEIIIVEMDPSLLRHLAEQDAAAKLRLGDRFAFISAEELPADQCVVSSPTEGSLLPPAAERSALQDASLYRLTYYSYTNNVPVHICMNNDRISSVQKDPRKGYQPEEGEEEIVRAIELARDDTRLADDVRNLHGHAILTTPEEDRYFWVKDEAGFGHRVFWVTFSETPESLPLYYARVDLTAQSVLDAGKEPKPQ